MADLRKLGLLLLAVWLVSCAKQDYPAPLHAIDISWQHSDPDFHLADAAGKARALADFNGKVKVVFFGYTHCPEVCPTTLADLAQAMRQLGEEAKNVQVIFVTLDPERDTPQVLGKFIPAFDPSFIGLYGDAQATARASQSFGVNFQKHVEKNGSYTLDHSDGAYLIGKAGKPLWLSRYGQRTDWLVQDIKTLLALK